MIDRNKESLTEKSVSRIRLISLMILMASLVLTGRLFYIQVVHGGQFVDFAHNQYLNAASPIYNRGSIYFLDKNQEKVTAANLSSGYILAINPGILENPEESYAILNSILSLSEEEFLTKASKKDDPYEELANKLDEATAEKIRQLKISGVGLWKEKWRNYLGDGLAAHVLGFVGWMEDEFSGRYGVEKSYENVLDRHEEGLYTNFFAEVFSGISSVIFKREQGLAGDLVLSIEPETQAFIEERLQDLFEEWQGSESGIIILNPKTGEIIAMAARPGFNPNRYGEEKNPSAFSNPLIEKVYEMGSIMKPITMASALDAGVVMAETTYYDNGSVKVGDVEISNFDKKGRGTVNMQEVLNQSLNTGSVFVSGKLGPTLFKQYLNAFALGDKTGIDLPNESAGLIEGLADNNKVTYATASFGQGFAVTPMAMTRALAVLANGGYLMKPHVVKKIEYDLGFSDEKVPTEQGRVIAREISEEITRMLVKVVDEALLKGKVKKERYNIAAKTGTAQIANAASGGYYTDRFLHSFFGYFPAYNPKFLIFLYIKEPKGVDFASQTLTYPFMEIVDFLINYYEIPPDR